MAQSELVQKSIDVASNPGNQGAVGVVTFITGWSTYFELLTPIIGAIAGVLGGALTVLLFINAYRKGRDDRKMRRLEREEKHLEIEALKKNWVENNDARSAGNIREQSSADSTGK